HRCRSEKHGFEWDRSKPQSYRQQDGCRPALSEAFRLFQFPATILSLRFLSSKHSPLHLHRTSTPEVADRLSRGVKQVNLYRNEHRPVQTLRFRERLRRSSWTAIR